MNERIRQLAEQATSIVESPPNREGWTSSYAHFDREKFAELIVRDCATKANATALDLRIRPELDARKYVGDCILKCFGVEE